MLGAQLWMNLTTESSYSKIKNRMKRAGFAGMEYSVKFRFCNVQNRLIVIVW